MTQEFPVFKANKKDPIRISWHGNEECFNKNQKIILDSIGNGVLQWKRDSHTTNFPLNLRFQPSFVPFDADCSIIKNGNSNDNMPSTFAFLHFYFIFPKNFEEYRISVRPEISEWFSDLTEANCQSWLIIFDSSRVKDKKNRSQINDKLKNDFAKFQNRIFESNEFSSEKSKSTLTSLIQNNLFSSFDNYSNNLINRLRKLKEIINEDNFVLSNFINEQFRLCLFYWSLGLFEQALIELDSLTSFFADSIRALAQKNDSALNSLNWLKQLRPLPLDKCCILLNQQLYNSSNDDWQLVRIHAHLLSHQILLSASLLSHRLNLANTPSSTQQHSQENQNIPSNQVLAVKGLSEVHSTTSNTTITTTDSSAISSSSFQSLSQPSSTTTTSQLNTLQLRHDCISTILNLSRETFQRLEEDLHILSTNFNSFHLNLIFIFWQEEIIKFVEYLLFSSVDYELENKNSVYDELVVMESASASHAAFLLHKKFEALYNLYLLLTNTKKSQEVTLVRRWLQQTSLPSTEDDTNNIFIPESFRILNDFFCNLNTDLEKFRIYVIEELSEALNIFKKHNWMGHVVNLENCISTISNNSNEDLYNREKQHLKKLLSGDSLFQVLEVVDYLKNFLNDYTDRAVEQSDNEVLFDCILILLTLLKNSVVDEFDDYLSKLTSQERIRNNISWLNYNNSTDSSSYRPLVQFPFKIIRICSPPLFRSTLHSPSELILDVYNSFNLQFSNCKIKTIFKKLIKTQSNNQQLPLTKKFAFQQKLQIEENENIYSLECVVCKKEEEKLENNNKNEEIINENVDCIIVDGNVDLIVPGVNKCIFKINENKHVGCFQLCSIQIHTINPKCTFILDYGREMERNVLLEHVFLLVDRVEPSISVKDKSSGDFLELTEGMRQKISLEFYSGTNSYLNDTFCSFSLVGVENKHLQFLDSEGKWVSDKVQHLIPPIKPNESYCNCIELCMTVDKVLPINSTNGSNSPQNEEIQSINCELKLEWKNASETIVTKFLQLKFSPLFGLYCTTSLLAGNAIFILDVERRFVKSLLNQITILPTLITLHQEQNIALEPVEAKLLNPNPLIPIIPNSSFRFIWRLPESPAGRNFPVPHFLKFIYTICPDQKENKNSEINKELIESEEYCIEKQLDFTIPKVDFEICARFYSEHSQSLLCRVDQPCDFVVSLRSLAKLIEAETVIVSIENENINNGWYCQQKHKLAKVKDSGVGQAIFSIVPKMLGHLPYPSISLYKYIASENSSKQLSINEKRFGERLITFYRNKGTQIHILAPLSGSEESTSLASTNTSESEQKKKSLKSQAKDRLSRLFE
uniref:TRAPPC10/Trs130 N-terminal domain-containing protein n=1 Tax=Meloidogyne incognita TaxID=6306 RepID=A0A914KVU2_MELIC